MYMAYDRLYELAKENFDPYVGQTFQLVPEPDHMVPLELVEVTALPARPIPSHLQGKGLSLKWREFPFLMVFRGPRVPPLPQRMYTLVHDQMATIEGLFFVPIGEDEKGRYYQVILN
jgi:hypothetical protein